MPRLTAALTALFGMTSCLGTLDSGELTRTSSPAPAVVNCSGCHSYELEDPNHYYHLLYSPLMVKQVNGLVTCLDCHYTSIQSAAVAVLDSIFRDSSGRLRSTLDYPDWDGIRYGTLVQLDTLVQRHPLPSRRKTPGERELPEWRTGPAHLNGTVNVDFDSSASDTSRFQGRRAIFNPIKETCSAVRCHSGDGPYRFADCSKGLEEWTANTDTAAFLCR